MRSSRQVFFPRPADADNLNAQAKNSQHILRHWQSRDCRPTIVAFGAPDAVVAANDRVELLPIRDNRWWRVALYFAYFRRFDAVFCPGVHHYVDWLALQTRVFLGCKLPVICTFEGFVSSFADDRWEEAYSAVAGHRVYCHKISQHHLRRIDDLMRMADHIIAISPFLGRMAESRYGSKVTVLSLGVDTEMFARPAFHRRWRPRVVGAGTVYARKRPELFLALADKFPQADFIWFGEGELRALLITQAASRGLRNLRFPGPLPPQCLAQEFASSDIFILPSLCEGVPKVSQEAAAAGLAQIIFGFYEAPTVVDRVNGYIVWSDEELFDRLAQLASDPDGVERMGRAGQEMARDWSWSRLAPQWERRITDAVA